MFKGFKGLGFGDLGFRVSGVPFKWGYPSALTPFKAYALKLPGAFEP